MGNFFSIAPVTLLGSPEAPGSIAIVAPKVAIQQYCAAAHLFLLVPVISSGTTYLVVINLT